jgi:hypothetical protein
MDKILAAKAEERKRIAALPIDQKFTILEKLRDRSFSIRNPTVVAVTGAGVVLSAVGARLVESQPLACHQLPDQLNTHQNSETLLVELRKRPERWLVEKLEEPGLEFASPSQALLDFRPNQQTKS